MAGFRSFVYSANIAPLSYEIVQIVHSILSTVFKKSFQNVQYLMYLLYYFELLKK